MTSDAAQLSRRERQIMEIVYELDRATAADVRANMPDPPSYSAVRAMLRILEEKVVETFEEPIGRLSHSNVDPEQPFVAFSKPRIV